MLSSISILLKRRRQRRIQEIKAEARKIAAQELGARRSLRRSPRAENPELGRREPALSRSRTSAEAV